MICPCGGRAESDTRAVRTQKALLQWFPEATDYLLPVRVTVTRCRVCGRQDKSVRGVKEQQHGLFES